MKTIAKHKGAVSVLIAGLVSTMLFFLMHFPDDNTFISLIYETNMPVYVFIKTSWVVFLFSTPYFLTSFCVSAVFIFIYNPSKRQTRPYTLPKYISPENRDTLYVTLGELHHPKKYQPAENPAWLNIPERGLVTGIAVFGAIGSGKTSGCMRPYVQQLLSWKADYEQKKIGGLILEVKGDFCYQVKDILRQAGREKDYIEVSLEGEVVYNPLHNDLDPYALAYQVASLLNNLFGKGKDPFWQQAYTNLVKFIILLHKTLFNYVTFFDIYICAISPDKLESLIEQGRYQFDIKEYILLKQSVYFEQGEPLAQWEFRHDPEMGMFRTFRTQELVDTLDFYNMDYEILSESSNKASNVDLKEQFEAVERWFYYDWMAMDLKLRTSIVEGISVFLSLFDDNPRVKKIFCPPAEAYDSEKNRDGLFGMPLPSFSWGIEQGKVIALNFPVSLNAGLARTLGTLMKMDYQRAVLGRIPRMKQNPSQYVRPTLFCCDEYQNFATTGESDPNGDEKFFALSREPRCIPIVATQSISSLKSTLPGDSWRTLLQTFRTKIFLTLSDEFSTRMASELCGKEDKLKINTNISESNQNAKVNFFSGRAYSDKSSVSTSRSYNVQRDYVFDPSAFSMLKNVQSITLAYDGLNPLPPSYLYLKPWYLDINKSYFMQLQDNEI